MYLVTLPIFFQFAPSMMAWYLYWLGHVLILQALVDKDPGLTGNLLVERLVGAHIDIVSKEEYGNVGSVVCLLYPFHYSFSDVLYDHNDEGLFMTDMTWVFSML